VRAIVSGADPIPLAPARILSKARPLLSLTRVFRRGSSSPSFRRIRREGAALSLLRSPAERLAAASRDDQPTWCQSANGPSVAGSVTGRSIRRDPGRDRDAASSRSIFPAANQQRCSCRLDCSARRASSLLDEAPPRGVDRRHAALIASDFIRQLVPRVGPSRVPCFLISSEIEGR